MSKTGNLRVEVQESADYQFGWESAERGEPLPDWEPQFTFHIGSLRRQQRGWQDYHDQEQRP